MKALDAGRLEVTTLAAFLLFTLVALGGYWNFALHPERLAAVPGAAGFFATSFQFFARAHIALSALALGVVLVGRTGVRWLPALGAVFLLSFASEHMGTGYGIPFGGYGYTAMLGPTLLGRVPWLIPLSWFLMALPAWLVARHFVGPGAAPVVRIALGALWLTVWDLALDPAMSFLTSYWVWQESGPYYGMPWMNLAGWYATGLVLMTALEFTSRRFDPDRLPLPWIAAYYATVALMPVGMLVAAGAWLAVGVSLIGFTGAWIVSRAVGRRTAPTPVARGAR